MKEVTLKLRMMTLPPVVLRGQQALILVRTSDDRFVIGGKSHYPQGISRLVGGGIEKGEEPLLGAARELQEELGFQVKPTDLVPLAKINVQVTNPEKNVTFAIYVYFYQLTDQTIKASDDLDSLVYLSQSELLSLIKAYQELPKTIDEVHGFAWFDYGQLYNQVHQIALDEYLKLAQS